VDVGASALAYPLFPGSNTERVLPIPAVEIHHGDRFFASVREGVGYNLWLWNGFKAGPVANFAFPRRVSDQPAALKGLGDVAFTLETGGFVRYDFGQFVAAKVEARQGVNGHRGLVVDMSADLNAPPMVNNRLFLSIGPRFSYYDHRYSQSYFGVTPLQSAASGYAPFQASDGETVGGEIASVFVVSHRITWTIFGDYQRLLGDIARSPIVRGAYGSRDQYVVGSAVTYRFNLGG
jgi:outer membrane scaffolding protein for murein synthesis (MipA/OmpV family)